MEYRVVFTRYDEAGNAYDAHIEGKFECNEDGVVTNVTEGLHETVSKGDTLADAHRKLQPPYYRIEPATSDLH